MPTLEEVIRAIEVCRDSYVAGKIIKSDALHYLKEYRDLKSTMDWHTQMEEIRNSIENVPLTWDELRKMEGKPVWVEYDDHFPGRKGTKFKEWEVIDVIFDDRLVAKGEWDYHKNEMGHVWQAYRKARTDEDGKRIDR